MDRQQWRPPIGEVAFGAFRLVAHERALYRHGVPVRLTGRAYDLLVALVERAGTVVGKDELIARIWPGTVVEEGNLRVHVAALRKALGNDGPYVENVTGRGYCFVAPLHQGNGHAAAPLPPVLVPPLVPHAAPEPWLVGRAQALDHLCRELSATRLLTIAGPGGMGKTLVAQALAARTAPRFGRHVYSADLAPLADAALVPGAVARAFGLAAPLSVAALADALPHALRARPALLVLDGCEHLVDAVAGLATVLLRRTRELRIVATSREPLRADGEHVFRLPPLEVPGAATLRELAGCPSVQLFVERASADGGFVLDEGNAAAVAEICRRLDGIPLALELAAGRAAFFGVHELARRLSDRFAVLTRGRRTALPRHQTLRATLDWSHALLAPAEQAVLRRLAVFRAAFTIEGAAAVAGFAGIPPQAVAGHVARLAAKSMVSMEEGRCRLLDTTRAYAAECLRGAGEEATVAQRHLRHCCLLLERAGHDPAALDEARLDDVRAALDWAFGPGGEPLLGARLAADSAPLWYRHSMMDDYRARLAPALACAAAAGSAGAPLAAALHLALGHALLHTGEEAAPRAEAFGRALALAERSGEHAIAVRALWGCYADALLQGEYGRALDLARRFGPLAWATGIDGDGRVRQRLLARARHYLGDQHAARAHAARAHVDAAGHPARGAPGAAGFQFDQRVSSLAIHGRVLWLQGLPEQAVRAAREGVDEALRLDHAISLCFALMLAVPVALWSGDLPMARRCVAMMAERAARDRLANWAFWARAFEAALHRHDGRRAGIGAEPVDLLLRHPSCTGLHLDMLPTLHAGLMTPASLARARDGRAGWAAPELLRCWGEQLVRVGAAGQAERVFRQALALARQQGALAWELRAATSLAELLSSRGAAAPDSAAVLAPLLARYREGAATRDVVTAQACLQRCRA